MKVARMGLLLGFAMTGSPCMASGVAFLPDGKSVVRCEETSMWIKDLDEKFHEQEIKLPEALYKDSQERKDPPIPDIARTADGLLIVAAETLAMTWNPASKEWKELWHPPADHMITDVACDPKTGGILFDTAYTGADRDEGRYFPWFYWAKGEKEPAKVYNRRAPEPGAPFFDVEGNLHFICQGDLWKGYIEKGEYPEASFVLGGKRTWPIADLETSGGSRDGEIAKQVVAFGDKLLVRLDYSHSYWATVRVPNVDAQEKGLSVKWEDVFGDESHVSLALSPDGKTAAGWNPRSGRWWIMEKPDGEFEPFSTDADIDRHAKEAAEKEKENKTSDH